MTHTTELAAITGVSTRVLDHWVRRGYIPTGNAHPGSGNPRQYSPAQERAVRIMAALTRIGFRPASAAIITRMVPTERPQWDIFLDGVTIRVEVGEFDSP